MLPPVPLVMEALGNVAVAPGLSAAPLTGQSDLVPKGAQRVRKEVGWEVCWAREQGAVCLL